MFSKKGNIELIKNVLDEYPFYKMTEEELLENIALIKVKLDELKAEYAFRVHMENGLESYDYLSDDIKNYIKIYKLLLGRKKILKGGKKNNNLNVKDLSDNEEYLEKYLLNIPHKIIPLKEKVKTR